MVRLDNAQRLQLDRPDDALAVEPLQWNGVDRRPVGNEMARRVDMGAVMADHMNFREVQRIVGHGHEPADARLGKERHA